MDCFRFLRSVLAFILILVFSNFKGFAQELNRVGGIVVDGAGRVISGVKVQEKNASNVTFTDEEGRFDIELTNGSRLIFDADGFKQAVYKVSNSDTSIHIQLHENYFSFSDTVDMLFDRIDRSLLVNSVSGVTTNQIAATPASLYAYSLTGRLTGLYTSQGQGFRSFSNVGDANSSADLAGTIAKTGLGNFSDNNEISMSLRGQNPVVVVDGIQRDLYSIDPENIESVNVLKDGLSSLALGQRSSRGVLLVTTKRPQMGRPRLSFTAQYGIQEPIFHLNPVSSFNYAYLVNEALSNEGRKGLYSVNDIEAYRENNDPYLYPDVDWRKEAFKNNAPLYRYNLNLSGGNKTAQYNVFLNYMDQEGILNTSDPNAQLQLQRYTIDSKVNINVTDEFKLKVRVFGRIQDGTQPGSTVSSILDKVLTTPSNAYPIYNPNGSYGGTKSFSTNLKASLDESGYMLHNDRDIMADIGMRYDFGKFVKGLWLNINGNLSVQSNTMTNRSLQVPVYQMVIGDNDTNYVRYGSASSQSNSFIALSNSRYWYSRVQVGYDRSYSDHHFQSYLSADVRRVTLNFDLPGTENNYMVKVNYNYAKKYILEGGVNYSGYDRYSPGHQFGVFYGIGAGWNMAREDFIHDNVKWLDVFKLRVNYARTGNGVENSGYFLWRQDFTQSNDETGIAGITHDRAQIAIVENGLANPFISWEKADKFDVGVDLSAFKNKLNITADYYRDVYFDLLQVRGKNIALLGTAYPPENIGRNLYTGGEIDIRYQNHVGSFNYFVSVNGTSQKSEVLFMDEQRREYPWNARTGQKVGQRFGYVAYGFFQSEDEIQETALMPGFDIIPGDMKFLDLNGDGIIDQFDQTAIGKKGPLYYYGLNAGFSIKGFAFSILLQGVKNRDIYIDDWNTEAIRSLGDVYGQVYEQLNNRWTPETASQATYPILKASGGFGDPYSLSSSTFWLHDGDYWRIKNINLQYSLPLNMISKLKLTSLTVFANIQNLYTWAAYDRADPEVGYGSYPIQRVYNMGINIKL